MINLSNYHLTESDKVMLYFQKHNFFLIYGWLADIFTFQEETKTKVFFNHSGMI